jgi:SRSO17 transposase
VLVIDETGFLKMGTTSAGVACQDRDTAGQIETCRIGVVLPDAALRGRALLDRALELPEHWATDHERRAAPRCRRPG